MASKFHNIATAISQLLICLTVFILKTKQILLVRALEKDACCLSVVSALMVDCQLKVKNGQTRPILYRNVLFKQQEVPILLSKELCCCFCFRHWFVVEDQHPLVYTLLSIVLACMPRLLSKKNFKEPTRPNTEELGTQHVKCCYKNLCAQSNSSPGYWVLVRQQPCRLLCIKKKQAPTTTVLLSQSIAS